MTREDEIFYEQWDGIDGIIELTEELFRRERIRLENKGDIEAFRRGDIEYFENKISENRNFFFDVWDYCNAIFAYTYRPKNVTVMNIAALRTALNMFIQMNRYEISCLSAIDRIKARKGDGFIC